MKASGGFYTLWRLFHFLKNAKVLFNADGTIRTCDQLIVIQDDYFQHIKEAGFDTVGVPITL